MAKQRKFGLPVSPAAIGFRPEFLDFQRGIRVGNLRDDERITRLLKLALEHRYQEPFVTERWGRGVFWQWIGFLSRSNRSAKPVSSGVSFGCAKYFLMVDTEDKLFKCGLQVERGYIKAPPEYSACELREDWDWHRLIKQLRSASPLERELRRLVLREGFMIYAGSWEEELSSISKNNFSGARKIRRWIDSAPDDRWAGFQLYYPFTGVEVLSMSGLELVEAMLAVYREVTPAMNLCMQIRLSH